MKLWLLKPNEHLTDGDNPWQPWYDKCFGMVIRAETEERARQIAHENASDENRNEFLGEFISQTNQPWLNKKYSDCIELNQSGEEGLILQDMRMA